MIDLSALRSLLAVHQHGSVVAAAHALDFTPSAVSQQVKRLERQQGAALLERVGRGVVLTDVGRLLVERGSRVLDDLESLENLGHDGSRPVGPFHLATFATAHRGLVAPLLARLSVQAPELRITTGEADPREVVRQVARGAADAGLVHDWESVHLELPAGVDAAPVHTDRADLVVHQDHPFAARSSVTPRDLVREQWVCTPAGTICHDWLVGMFAHHALRPDLRFIDPEYASHVALARAGVAVALVPRLGRGPLPEDVVTVPVVDPVPQRRVQLVWRRATTDSPARRLVHAVLGELAGDA
ncbi:LysR family transcriptional regulator [Aeromicrobium sp. CF4.19]|uniref:LysR family transcriptional regulator n=1 Tax=Aeromicrobium sp. CF4.19 TaxID=3373082 RepID=UPI003EE5CA89